MSHAVYFGQAVFTGTDAVSKRDTAHRALEDWIDATLDAEPYDWQGTSGGVTDFNNLHLGDSDGPGLAYSFRINISLADQFMAVLQPYVLDVTEDHSPAVIGLGD